MSKTTITFDASAAFRASGVLLRDRAANGCAIASAELARRSGGKGGYVRESLRAGVKPACWKREEPTVAALLKPAKVAKAKPAAKPVAAPKAAAPKRDTIAAVRADLNATAKNVLDLTKVVEKLVARVSAALPA